MMDAMGHTRLISCRREQFHADFTKPSTLSGKYCTDMISRHVEQGKTFLHSLQIRSYKEHNGIILRLPRRHLHVVGERLHTLEDRMKHVHHGT